VDAIVETRLHEYHMEARRNIMSKDKLLGIGERYEAMTRADPRRPMRGIAGCFRRSCSSFFASVLIGAALGVILSRKSGVLSAAAGAVLLQQRRHLGVAGCGVPGIVWFWCMSRRHVLFLFRGHDAGCEHRAAAKEFSPVIGL